MKLKSKSLSFEGRKEGRSGSEMGNAQRKEREKET